MISKILLITLKNMYDWWNCKNEQLIRYDIYLVNVDKTNYTY